MTIKQRTRAIIDYFAKNNPVVETELKYSNPFQLLVAVVLSAQCTDKRVNIITPLLFKKFQTVFDFEKASIDEIREEIKQCSYPNSKAKYLSDIAKTIVEKYGGELPNNSAELQKLNGVGRKTANVVASILYKEQVIAVDTHIFRLSNRLGIVENCKAPSDVEKQLTQNIDRKYLADAHHWLILHGRYVCKARKPLCENCEIKKYCDYYKK